MRSFVVKRDGSQADVSFDKITARVVGCAAGLNEACDPYFVTQRVIAGLHPGCTTTELDELSAETAAALASTHPDYSVVRQRALGITVRRQPEANHAAWRPLGCPLGAQASLLPL